MNCRRDCILNRNLDLNTRIFTLWNENYKANVFSSKRIIASARYYAYPFFLAKPFAWCLCLFTARPIGLKYKYSTLSSPDQLEVISSVESWLNAQLLTGRVSPTWLHSRANDWMRFCSSTIRPALVALGSSSNSLACSRRSLARGSE